MKFEAVFVAILVYAAGHLVAGEEQRAYARQQEHGPYYGNPGANVNQGPYSNQGPYGIYGPPKQAAYSQGPPGPPGQDGKDGKDGHDGTDGKDGKDGQDCGCGMKGMGGMGEKWDSHKKDCMDCPDISGHDLSEYNIDGFANDCKGENAGGSCVVKCISAVPLFRRLTCASSGIGGDPAYNFFGGESSGCFCSLEDTGLTQSELDGKTAVKTTCGDPAKVEGPNCVIVGTDVPVDSMVTCTDVCLGIGRDCVIRFDIGADDVGCSAARDVPDSGTGCGDTVRNGALKSRACLCGVTPEP